MSKEFIEKQIGLSNLTTARRQQRQLSYLCESQVQEDVDFDYIAEQICNRNYKTTDHFLHWIQSLFKAENFKAFYKHVRYPLPSARLIKNKVIPHLERVFNAEDSYFRYTVKGEEVATPDILEAEKFNKKMFNAMLFQYNDIVMHDMEGVNLPTRYIVSIDDVRAIYSKDDTIHQIAYAAMIDEIPVYIYADAKEYIVYSDDLRDEIATFPHDLRRCPAEYIAKDSFKPSDNDIVRSSFASYVREELEEYVFLKVLLKMADPNGSLPIVVSPRTADVKAEEPDQTDIAPMSSNNLSDKKKNKTGMILQAGTHLRVPMVSDDNGKVDMSFIKEYLQFFRIPVDSLNYMNTRIQEIEKSIIVALVGDYHEADKMAKNQDQVAKSYDDKQDKVREISKGMTRLRFNSDMIMLGLAHGIKNVGVDLSYGTDFFLESQDDLYALFAKAPNQIERKTILIRLAQNRGKHNEKRMKRDVILYKLLPFSSDKDFDKAQLSLRLDPILIQKQLRFSHFINTFESQYGDIVAFWELFEDVDEHQILVTINKLLDQIIKSDDQVRELEPTPDSTT